MFSCECIYYLWTGATFARGLLETAINSFVDFQGKHKIFDSDTDLIYPQDYQRFIKFLNETVKSAIEYLNILDRTLYASIDEDDKKESFKHWISAGQTNFKFIKK